MLEIIDPDTRYQEVSQLLMEAEKEEQLQLSDFSYHEMVCYLIIMIERIKHDQRIDVTENLAELQESSKAHFAQTIIEKSSSVTGLSLKTVSLAI